MLRKTYNYKCVINQYFSLYLTHAKLSIGEENRQVLETIKNVLEVFMMEPFFFSFFFLGVGAGAGQVVCYPTSTQVLKHYNGISYFCKI